MDVDKTAHGSMYFPIYGQPLEYPRSWFKRLESKPAIKLEVRNMTLNELRGIIKSQIQNRNLTLESAKFYLYLVLKEVKETLNRDWTSYGVVIGTTNSAICPWDLLKITMTEALVITDERTVEATSQDDQWMVIYILSIYRLQNTDMPLRRAVIAKIVDQMKMVEKTFILSAMEAASNNTDCWYCDGGYLGMIVAVDMFFTRFAFNSWAKVKVGTVGSRFKGCGALMAIEHMRTMLGISYARVKNWIFMKTVSDEIRQMMRDEEEIGEEFSYFPYQMDLRLVTKSAYSVNANPNTFLFAHSTCALLGSERSKNAKLPRDISLKFQPFNVILMAYAFSKNLGNPNNTEEVKVLSTASGIPQNTSDAAAWLIFMKKRDHVPEDMVAFFTKAKNKIGAVRNGTIGKYVMDTFNVSVIPRINI